MTAWLLAEASRGAILGPPKAARLHGQRARGYGGLDTFTPRVPLGAPRPARDGGDWPLPCASHPCRPMFCQGLSPRHSAGLAESLPLRV